MSDYAGPNAVPRDGEFSDTLKLLLFVALSVIMMAMDQKTNWLGNVRTQLTAMAQPIWAVAGMPTAAARKVSADAGSFASLTAENEHLRSELMLNRARMARAESLAASMAQTAGLVQSANRQGMAVTIASVLDVDLDPTRQRLLIRAGSKDGVRVGQTVMDEGGLLGQVINVQNNISTVLLLTDPDHAVPVMIQRNGVRLIASGAGNSHLLDVINVPLATDIKIGDVVVTSGMGQRFAAGLPVGRITRIRADDSRAFLVGEIAPAARLDRGLQVMVVQSVPLAPPIQVEAVDPTTDPTPQLKRDPSIPLPGSGEPNAAGNPVTDAAQASGVPSNIEKQNTVTP